MENPEQRKRVRFFDPQREEPGITGERTVLSLPSDNLEGDKKVQNWLQNQFLGPISSAYDPLESEFAAAVAAAAFAIYSLEEDEEQYRRKRRQDLEQSKATNNEGKEDTMGGSRAIRLFSSNPKDAEEPSLPKPPEPDQRVPEGIQPSRITSRSTSMRPLNLGDKRQRGSSLGDVVVTRADSWETAQLMKIHKRYEKMASDIQAWENAKKMEAKLRMERKQNDLEARTTVNMQHYENKVGRIDMIAGGARRQLEEKRINEESEVKEKAKYKRMKRKSPLRCFCC